MNYNTLRNKPTINYKEIIGDNTVADVGGITEEEFDDLLDRDLASYYTKAQIDELFSRSFVYREKSGSIVTFDCPASVNGIDKVVSEIVAVQSGTGDPSPTNVRPISGWSAVGVVVSPTTDAADGTTYTTTLKDGQGNPMTCYGGQLTNENGVQRLVNGRVKLTNDYLVNTASYESAGRGCFVLIGITLKSMGSDVVDTKLMASALKTSSQNDLYANKNVGIAHWWNTRLGFSTGDETITTVSVFKQWLADNGSDVVYELATPQQIPQDSLSIATQDGTNNIWADSGDITVKALDRIIQG